MKKEKKILVGVFGLFSILLLVIGVTYAWFTYSRTGERNNSIQAGEVTFRYDEKSQGISVNDAMPMTDAQGKVQSNYFEFDVTSKTSPNTSIPYYVTVNKVSGSDANLDSYIKVYLTKVTGEAPNQVEIPVTLLTTNQISRYSELSSFNHSSINISSTEKALYTDTVPAGSNNYKETYRLRMWIADNINMNSSGTGTSPYNGSTYTLKVNVYSEGSIVSQTPSVPQIASCPDCKYVYTTNYLTYGTSATALNNEQLSSLNTNYLSVVNESGSNVFLGLKVNETTHMIEHAYACGIEGENPNSGTAFCVEGALKDSEGGSTETRNAVYRSNYTTTYGVWHDDEVDPPTAYGSFRFTGSVLSVLISTDGSVGINDDDSECVVTNDGTLQCIDY